jgi:hemerythrin superfamily protein
MNSVVNRMTPSITTMIRMDHAHVMALSHRYTPDTPAARKRALITNACIALEVHAQLEEEIFYPVLRQLVPEDEVLEKSEPEHAQVRAFVAQLRERCESGEPLDQDVDEKFFALMRAVLHHVADEEARLLPVAERMLSHEELTRLGGEMTRRRLELMKPHGWEIATSTVRSFPVGAATGAALVTAGAVALGAMLFSRSRRNGRHEDWRASDADERRPTRFM